MAKVKLKKITIVALNKERERMLGTIQRLGIIDIKESINKSMEADSIGEQKIVFDKDRNLADEALEVLDRYSDDENKTLLSSFAGPSPISEKEYYLRATSIASILNSVNRIIYCVKSINELNLNITREQNKILGLEVWDKLDIPIDTETTDKTKIFIGTLKNVEGLTDIYDKINKNTERHIDVEVSIITADKENTYFIAICHKDDAEELERALKMMEFARPQLSGKIPAYEIKVAKEKIEDYKEKIKGYEKELKEFGSIRKEIRFFRDVCAIRYDMYDTISKLTVTDNVSIIEGYIPANKAEQTKEKLLSLYDSYIEIDDIEEDEEAPVLLKNGFYAEPMETVVESYSLPNNNEMDPSGILSIFYYVLFGLMLSDAGYGLLLVIGTGIILGVVRNMKPEMKKMMKLFFFGGIFTIMWGILFGSFFGNAIDVIAMYIRGTETVEPVFVPFLKRIHVYWFNPVDDPMRLLVFAFIIGLIHLFTGICLKGYLLLKQKLFKEFVYDVLFWILFVAGGVVYLLTMEMVTGMVGMEKPLGAPVPLISAIIMGIGCLGVVLTSGRESKNWFKRLLKGAYGAYGITGWLSDVLSYSRLLALGLATGIIAEVFNTMGSMVKIPVVGLIVFILVFIVGHTLNLGINVMGAYVHTNRLQFVEFFGKFYEGGGKKFTPFNENTRYYHIKED